MDYKIEAIRQFRELGGLPTTSGKHIKEGKFFRSAVLCGATDNDLKTLEKLGVTTVFDLRTPNEVKAAADREGSYKVVNIPAFLNDGARDVRFRGLQAGPNFYQNMDEPTYHLMHYLYTTSYYEMPYNTESFGQVFQAMNEHQTFLFHCAGGKDRTGVTAMLISLALGCDYATCKANYMLHNEITKEYCASAYQKGVEVGYSEPGMRAFHFCSEACEDFFDVAYNSIFMTYETIEDFLIKEYGITQAQIDDWRDFYLE